MGTGTASCRASPHFFRTLLPECPVRPATRIRAVEEPMATCRPGSTIKGLYVLASVCCLTGATFSADKQSPPDRKQIVQRMEAIQPTARERRFDAIGWASGIRAAEKLAREHDRP